MSEHGDLIRLAREKKGLSQRQLAFRVGHSDTYINAIEKGRQRGGWAALIKLAEVLDLPPQEMLTKADFRPIPVPTQSVNFDLETHQFTELDPEVKLVLLELAPVIKRCLDNNRGRSSTGRASHS